jgi:prepilin signal peptidase PulO-like enzyme (type II secretory pathway)
MPSHAITGNLGFMVATLLCMAVALMALAPLSRLGNRSIAQWIDGPTLQRLHHISVAWWLLTVAAAFVLFWAAGPALHDARPATAALAALLIGLLSTLLVLLARIDAQCRLLPDPLTGLLVATGLMAHGLGLPPQAVSLRDGIIGCAAGYGLLWLIAEIFRRLKNDQAMGRGDFAMSAGLGAWMGWQSIAMVWLIASLCGLVMAGLRYLRWPFFHRQGHGPNPGPSTFLKQQIAFGPALALGGIITWIHLG